VMLLARTMKSSGLKALRALGLCVILQTIPSVQAEELNSDPGYKELMNDFSPIDFGAINFSHCDISQTLNFDKYRLGMANIREAWLYKDKPVELYQRHAYSILYIVGRKWATLMTQALYLKPEAQTCRFRLLISDQDKFGNDHPFVLVSWRFTRELANKTHWDKLDDKKFSELAADWKWGQEFVTRANQEGRE
jgi:hypothetical protein